MELQCMSFTFSMRDSAECCCIEQMLVALVGLGDARLRLLLIKMLSQSVFDSHLELARPTQPLAISCASLFPPGGRLGGRHNHADNPPT